MNKNIILGMTQSKHLKGRQGWQSVRSSVSNTFDPKLLLGLKPVYYTVYSTVYTVYVAANLENQLVGHHH